MVDYTLVQVGLFVFCCSMDMGRVGRWRGLDNVSHRSDDCNRWAGQNGEKEAPGRYRCADLLLLDRSSRSHGPPWHSSHQFLFNFSGKIVSGPFLLPVRFLQRHVDFDSLLRALSDRSIHFLDNTQPQVGLLEVKVINSRPDLTHDPINFQLNSEILQRSKALAAQQMGLEGPTEIRWWL